MAIFLGLLFGNFEKAIEYGDAPRMDLCYTFMIPMFRTQCKHKYANLILQRKLVKLAVIPSAVAFEYEWNSTIGE